MQWDFSITDSGQLLPEVAPIMRYPLYRGFRKKSKTPKAWGLSKVVIVQQRILQEYITHFWVLKLINIMQKMNNISNFLRFQFNATLSQSPQ